MADFDKNPDEFMPNEKALDNLKIVKSIGEPLLRNKLEDEIKSLVKDDIMEIVNNLKNKKEFILICPYLLHLFIPQKREICR